MQNVPYFFKKMDKAQIWKGGAMILWLQEMDVSEFSSVVFNVFYFIDIKLLNGLKCSIAFSLYN